MSPGRRSRRPFGCLVCAFALAAPLGLPAAAPAMSGAGDLAPRLVELAKPSLRSAPERLQARELGLAPSGPGSLSRRGNRVLVYVRFRSGAIAGVPGLRDVGADVVDASRRYQTVTVAAKPAELREIAAVPDVAGVTPVLAPLAAASSCPAGKVVSEGVEQLNAGDAAGEARDEFSVDGGGITVGILSDSFNQATEAVDGSGPVETTAQEDVESGDLPGVGNTCVGQTTPVLVLQQEQEAEEATDEGRAMAQIVHDVAPGAALTFASAFNGEASFAKNIEDLSTVGAEVIVDDVFYFEEPFFQDGPVAVAANEVVADGSAYFSAVGNENIIDAEGHDIASWETAPYRDSGGCPAEVQALSGANGTHCLDFHPGAQADRTFGIKVEPDSVLSVDLQWAEPWFGVDTDLDAFLLNASGDLIAAAGEDNVGISQKPNEILQWENGSSSQQTVQLVVNRFAGDSPRLKFVLLESGPGVAATEYPRSTGEGPVATDIVGPTVIGHSGAASVIAVGAVPFNTSSKPESYSSRGPARHDFGPVKGTTPAAPIAPQLISKPDVAATDCNLTTFFAFFVAGQGWRFCGTSAAAPHAAGVAALMLDEDGTATPAKIRAALQESAVAVGAFGPCAVGAGLIEAVGAIEALGSLPGTPPDQCQLPESEASTEEARAPGNWGLEAPPSVPPVTQTTNPPVGAQPQAEPSTFFTQRPRRVVRTPTRTARVVFRFGSDRAGVTFACRIDGGLFRPCAARLVRRFGLGSHSIRVVALDSSGNGDSTPATYRFRVKRIG